MGRIRLALEWANGRQITIEYSEDSGMTVKDMKEEVMDNYPDIDLSSCQIYFQGKVLEDGDVLFDKGVKNESQLFAALIAKMMRPVKVLCIDKEHTINLCLDGRFRDLKKAISEQMGIPQSLQVLSANGKEFKVDESTTLKNAEIVEGTVISLNFSKL